MHKCSRMSDIRGQHCLTNEEPSIGVCVGFRNRFDAAPGVRHPTAELSDYPART
jgi:hypothetical protein